MMSRFTLYALLALATTTAAEPKNEPYYVDLVCTELGGVQEYRTAVGVRVDRLTDTQAIELDWGNKWYEGITQALYYAMLTDRQAVVALIDKGKNPQRYVERARALIVFYGLPVEVVEISREGTFDG